MQGLLVDMESMKDELDTKKSEVNPTQADTSSASLELNGSSSESGSGGASGCGVRCLTIDVEDYYQIEAAHGRIPREEWGQWPSHVEANTDLLLELFAEEDVRATFFFLGSVAEQFPDLVRRTADAGHEIGSHGWSHHRIHRLTPKALFKELRDSRQLLEDLSGQAVLGFRAPTWSITHETAWAIETLMDAGYFYDASVFPVTHPNYGVPEAPAEPYMIGCGTGQDDLNVGGDSNVGGGESRWMVELPPLTWRVGERNLPVAGGGYFRLLPMPVMHRGIEQAAAEGRPAILYFHPWEFDRQLPKMPLSWSGELRTYTGVKAATRRLRRLIQRYPGWSSIAAKITQLAAQAGEQRFVIGGYAANAEAVSGRASNEQSGLEQSGFKLEDFELESFEPESYEPEDYERDNFERDALDRDAA